MTDPRPKANVALIIMIIVAAAFCSAAFMLYFWKENEVKEKNAIKMSLSQVLDSKSELETRLSELEASKAKLETTIQFQEEKITSLTKELQSQKMLLDENNNKLSEKDRQIEAIRALMQNVEQQREQMSREFQDQSETLVATKIHLKNILKTKAELEEKAKELAEKGPVSLGTIVIKQT